MSLGDFFSRYVLLPLTGLFQVFGYAESTFRITGLSHTFVVVSASFALSVLLIAWAFYFSHLRQSSQRKSIVLVCFVVFSIAYYTFVQYTLLNSETQDVFKNALYLGNARAFAQENPGRAITNIEKIKAKYREIPEVYNIQGIAYYHFKDIEKSFINYQKAVQLDPQNHEYRYNLAVLFRERCNFNESKRILEEYVHQVPLEMSGHYELAIIYHLLREYDNAIYEYIMVKSGNDDKLRESSLFNIAVIFAVKFQDEKNEALKEGYLSKIKLFLEESIRLGGEKRLNRIMEDMIPLDQRSSLIRSCDDSHITDDLTSLSTVEKFNEWLHSLRSRLLVGNNSRTM